MLVRRIDNLGLQTWSGRRDRSGTSVDSCSAASGLIDRVGFVLFLTAVCLSPWWLGSNRPFAWGLNAAMLGAALCLVEGKRLVLDEPHPTPIRQLFVPIAAAVAAILLVFARLAGFTDLMTAEAARAARAATGAEALAVGFLDVDAALLAGLQWFSVCAAFWLAVQFCRDRSNARTTFRVILTTGGIVCLAALARWAMQIPLPLDDVPDAYRAFATGPFVNRNSFATFAAMICIVATTTIVVMVLRSSGEKGETWRHAGGRQIDLLASKDSVALPVAIIAGAAMLLSGSRGGVVSGAIGMIAAFVLVSISNRRRFGRSRSESRTAAFVLVSLVAVALFIGLSASQLVLDRASTVTIARDVRWSVAQTVIEAVRAAPISGYGPGSFETIFPLVRVPTDMIMGQWDKAHGSYLEILLDFGIPVGIAIISVGLWIAIRCFRGALERRRDVIFPIAGFGVSVAVLLHAAVDFSLQIQAVALTYAVISGAGVAQSWSSAISPVGRRAHGDRDNTCPSMIRSPV